MKKNRADLGVKRKPITENLCTRVEAAKLEQARKKHGNVNPLVRELIASMAMYNEIKIVGK